MTIKTHCGITVRIYVHRIYSLRVYVAYAYLTGHNFRLDSWRGLDRRKVRRMARKGLELIRIK